MSSHRLVFQAFKETCKNNIIIVITLIISVITGIAMQLIPPQILRNIIDGHISKGITEGLWTLAYFYLLSVIVSGFADFIRELTMSIVGQNTLANIRYNMAKKLSKLPIAYFSSNSAGSIMSYFTSDVDVVGTLLTSGVIGIMADGLKMLGIIVSIYMLSPILVLYVLILIPIIYVITRKFKKATLKAQIEARKAVGKINGYIQELFTGIRTIKIFNREKDFVDRFQEPLNENIKAVNKTSIFDSVFPCVMQVLRAVIIALVVIISAPAGLGAMGITIGSLAACVELISRMLAPIESIAMEFQTIQEAISGLKRIQEFDSLQEEQRHIQEHINYEEKDTLNIRVDSLSFAYENGTEVVKDISFTIKPGTKVALIGKTGAGKSTILNLVAGLYEPSKGAIKVGDFNPFKIPANLRRRIMGIVPQNFNIYDGTIRDAITLYDKTISEEQIIKASKTVGLHDEIMTLPKGYDTIIGEGEVQLSHGQYQLLALACAIVCDPPILLLDEVTSGLDSVTEQKIFKVLREVSQNRTLLTISHRISGIIDADEVIILQRGRIIETGTPKELEGKEGWYAKYNQIEKLGWKIS